MNTPSKNALASDPTGKLIHRMAERYGVDEQKLLSTLKSTAFKVKNDEPTNEQMLALMVVADQYSLNPFTRELYAFPSDKGIVPIVGIDGWASIINEHPAFDVMEFEETAESCTCIMYRKDRSHPTRVTEYLAECRRSTGPWTSHPKRMLRHKAMIQCARVAFGFVGIYDEDEAERIIEGEVVKPTASADVEAPHVPEISPYIPNKKTASVPQAKEIDDRLVSDAQVKILRKLCEQSVKEFGLSEKDICEQFQISSLGQLKLRDYMPAVELLSAPSASKASEGEK